MMGDRVVRWRRTELRRFGQTGQQLQQRMLSGTRDNQSDKESRSCKPASARRPSNQWFRFATGGQAGGNRWQANWYGHEHLYERGTRRLDWARLSQTRVRSAWGCLFSFAFRDFELDC